jgi:acetoin utilization protein AcuB
MTRDPSTIHAEASLSYAIAKMKVGGCRQLPVVENGVLVGIITDRDIRLAVKEPELNLDYMQNMESMSRLKVEEYMTANPIIVTPTTPAARAAEMLSLYKFGALPVIEDGVMVGIITVSDFLNYMVSQLNPMTA